MEMVEVSSSNINQIGYDDETQTMGVEFHSGKVYHYNNVPKEVYEEFVEAPSVGRHFNTEIRGQYDGELVEG